MLFTKGQEWDQPLPVSWWSWAHEGAAHYTPSLLSSSIPKPFGMNISPFILTPETESISRRGRVSLCYCSFQNAAVHRSCRWIYRTQALGQSAKLTNKTNRATFLQVCSIHWPTAPESLRVRHPAFDKTELLFQNTPVQKYKKNKKCVPVPQASQALENKSLQLLHRPHTSMRPKQEILACLLRPSFRT